MKKIALLILLAATFINTAQAEFKPSIARYGVSKYNLEKGDFFKFRNLDAPKGGKISIGTVGTFDTVNMFIVKGVSAEGVPYTFAPLMRRSLDEPFTLYANIAESVDFADDASKITFKIDKRARFHDGNPITAEDIEFTINLLIEKGWPRYKQFYGKINKITIIDPHTITFEFKPDANGVFDPDLPMMVALMTPLQKKSLQGKDFLETGMTPLVGSGPYKIKSAVPGRSIVYERVKDYWGKDLPVNKGSANFDEIEIIYTKNATTHFQEFLTGHLDIYFEQDPNQWNTRYDVPQVKDGRITKLAHTHKRPVTIRTIIFNMRKPIFSDLRVRQALSLAFDFDTLNKMVFFGSFKRVDSLFANTPLRHTGAATELERKILDPLMPMVKEQIEKGELPTDVLDKPFCNPMTGGDGDQRDNLAAADKLLVEAGWTIQNGKRVNAKGDPFMLEFLVKDPRLEKIALSFQRSLKSLGIELKVRSVDTVQYESRTSNRDFDMIVHAWTNSLSPGVEQGYYFSRHTADIDGSSNYIGVKDALIENLATALAKAKTYDELQGYVHNLDRFVMHKNYMIPLTYDNTSYVAYYGNRIGFPTPDPLVGVNIIDNGWAIPQDGQHDSNSQNSPSFFAWIKDALKRWFS
ncbi:MAG: extracellular solute-binding protein [Alphaproteobacteria bacterium]|nr:extracellular solute-binding protein [Alphaproteobacteria bacterium]